MQNAAFLQKNNAARGVRAAITVKRTQVLQANQGGTDGRKKRDREKPARQAALRVAYFAQEERRTCLDIIR